MLRAVSLFLENRGEEHKTSDSASVSVSVTSMLRAASRVTSTGSRIHPPPLPPVFPRGVGTATRTLGYKLQEVWNTGVTWKLLVFGESDR